MTSGEAEAQAPGAHAIANVGRQLRLALERLCLSDPGSIPRPVDLSKVWRIDQTLAVRLCRALRSDDPLAVIYALPAPNSLRLLLKAAARRKVDPSRVAETEARIGDLERLIESVGGQKSNLDTIIGGQLLEVRSRTEHGSKQTLYRGMSNLLGLQVATSVVSYFVYPSDSGEAFDELAVYGVHRLRRLRTDLPTLLGGRNLTPALSGGAVSLARETLQSEALNPNGFATALQSFCSQPLPELRIEEVDGQLLYTLPGNELGGVDELSLIFASIEKHASPRCRTEEQEHADHRFVPRNPSQNLLLDVFLHRDVWPRAEPTLLVARSGTARARDRESGHVDLLDMMESVQSLGYGARAARTNLFPRYPELLDHVHGQMGWKSEDFRLYRCHVRYPIVGLWYSVAFPLPDPPRADALGL